MLLQYGANPNVASYANQLPIHRAAYQGHIEWADLHAPNNSDGVDMAKISCQKLENIWKRESSSRQKEITRVKLTFFSSYYATKLINCNMSLSAPHSSSLWSFQQRAFCLSLFCSSVTEQHCSSNRNLMNIFLDVLFSSFCICFSLFLSLTLFLFVPSKPCLSVSVESWTLSSQSQQNQLSVSQARIPSTQRLTGDRSSVWSCLLSEDMMSTPC